MATEAVPPQRVQLGDLAGQKSGDHVLQRNEKLWDEFHPRSDFVYLLYELSFIVFKVYMFCRGMPAGLMIRGACLSSQIFRSQESLHKCFLRDRIVPQNQKRLDQGCL